MWVFATRARPENCLRFINAWTQTQASSPVYVRIDDCDPKLNQILELPWPKKFSLNVGPRLGLKAALQEMFLKFPDEDWYGFLADDLVPLTKHWDKILIETAGNCNISYPNDLGKKRKRDLPTHPCVGGDLVRAIGWFGLPATYHYYLDDIYRFIGQNLNNIYRLEDVIVEHMHYGRGKAEIDETYNQSIDKMKNDTDAYNDWISTNGDKLIADLTSKGFKQI